MAAALSWLRRRGPRLPEAVLQRWFRKRLVICCLCDIDTGTLRHSADLGNPEPPNASSTPHHVQVSVVLASGDGSAKRVSKDAVLERGAQLLIPKSAAVATPAAAMAPSSGAGAIACLSRANTADST